MTRQQQAARALLLGLCSAPLLLGFYYAVIAPRVTYTNTIHLSAPGGSVPVAVDNAVVERQDRMIVLSPRPQRGQRPADLLHVYVRNNLRSAAAYHQIIDMEPADRVRLRLLAPPLAGQGLIVGADWKVEVESESDYAQQVRGRLWALVLGALCAAAISLGARRLRRRAGRPGGESLAPAPV